MSSRIGWIDIARGLAIIAVVVFHAALYARPIDGAGLWEPLVLMLETFRMPMFFFVSGLVSRSILTRPSRSIWSDKIAFFMYLYVLWAILQRVITAAIGGTLSAATFKAMPAMLWRPHDSLWFLYALAIFTAAVWAMRRLSAWVPVLLSAATSALFLSNGILHLIHYVPTPWMKTGSYVFFFVAGVYLREWALPRVANLSGYLAAGIVVGYLVVAPIWYVTPIRDIAITRGLVSMIGVAAGVALACLLARARGFRWLEYLGRNTLPIYVLHLVFVVAIIRVLRVVGHEAGSFEQLLLAPAIAVVAIALSLLVHRVTRRVPGLYSAPWTMPAGRIRQR